MNRKSQLREFPAVNGPSRGVVVIIHRQPKRDLVLAGRRSSQGLEDRQQHVWATARGEHNSDPALLDLGLNRGGKPGIVHKRRKLGNLRLKVNKDRSYAACMNLRERAFCARFSGGLCISWFL
jgi:hypothetical protein